MFNLEKVKKNFDKDGFCVLDKFYSQNEIQKLDSKVKDFIEFKSNYLKGRDINKTSDNSINTMHDIDKHDQYFEIFSNSQKVLNIASLLLNSEPDFRKCEMFAKPAKVGMPSPFHQDNFLWAVKNGNGLTFWVALDYCDELNGGLTYIKGTHKLGLLSHEESFAPGTSQRLIQKELDRINKDFSIITPKLKPGDLIVHHCLIVHGSGANKSEKSRRGFTMQFKDKFSGYDEELKNYYENSLKKQLQSRNQ